MWACVILDYKVLQLTKVDKNMLFFMCEKQIYNIMSSVQKPYCEYFICCHLPGKCCHVIACCCLENCFLTVFPPYIMYDSIRQMEQGLDSQSVKLLVWVCYNAVLKGLRCSCSHHMAWDESVDESLDC